MALKVNNKTERELDLRKYQIDAIDQIRDGMQAGIKSQILSCATGSGKTEMAVGIVQSAIEKGNSVAFLCDRTNLVKQASERFHLYGIEHGILQGENTTNELSQVMVCSSQTIEKRQSSLDRFNLLIIDECHSQRKAVNEYLIKAKPYVIGLTATPYSEGLGNIYESIVSTASTADLAELGYLVPMRVLSCTEINMEGVKKDNKGEWATGETSERVIATRGDIVAEWLQHTYQVFGKPVKTLCFAASVDDGAVLCESFQTLGYNFQQVSYRQKPKENARIIAEFKKPGSQIIGLVNSEMLVRGADVPDIQILISARPYRKSLISVLQMLGRGLRPYPNKEFCLLLDHASNFLRFRDPIMEFWQLGPIHALSTKVKEFAGSVRLVKRKDVTCKCGYIFQSGEKVCPMCGKQRPKRKPQYPIYEDGKMEEIDATMRTVKEKFPPNRDTWLQLCAISMEKKKAWGDDKLTEEAKKFAFAQYRSMFDKWPKGKFNPDSTYYDHDLKQYVKHRLIRWIKSQEIQQKEASPID